MGQTDPTSGTSTIGANVKVGYFSQHALDVLNPKNTVYEEVAEAGSPNSSISYVRGLHGAAFLFSGDDADKKISRFIRRRKEPCGSRYYFSQPG